MKYVIIFTQIAVVTFLGLYFMDSMNMLNESLAEIERVSNMSNLEANLEVIQNEINALTK